MKVFASVQGREPGCAMLQAARSLKKSLGLCDKRNNCACGVGQITLKIVGSGISVVAVEGNKLEYYKVEIE